MGANEKESVLKKIGMIFQSFGAGFIGIFLAPIFGVVASIFMLAVVLATATVVGVFHDEAAKIIVMHGGSLYLDSEADMTIWPLLSFMVIGFVWRATQTFISLSRSGFWTFAKRRIFNVVCGSCFIFVLVTGGPIHLWLDCPLCDMADGKNLARTKLWLAVGVNPNAAKNKGVTALMIAAHECQAETTDALIDGGADVNATTNEGKTALFYFVDKCVNEDARTKGDGVIYSLLDAGANPNIATSDGITALMLAAQADDGGIARMLIAAGANPNAAASDGWTPLMHAAWHWDIEITKILLEAGANPNLVTNDGRTALMLVKRFDTEFQEPQGLLNLTRNQARVARLLESAEAK